SLAGRAGCHAHDWPGELQVARGPEESCIPKREDAAIGGHQPIALTRWSRRHADDGLGEVQVAGRPEEPGVTEREEAAISGHQPIAITRRAGGHAHDRL